MPLTFITAAGEVISADEGGPFQYTPEGFNSGLAESSVPLSQWTGGGASYASLYETQPWVAIAVNFLTRQISRLPLKVYTRDSQGNKQRQTSGALYDAIQNPAPRCGPIHLKQWMFFPTLLHGNGAIRKVRPRAGNAPTGFLPLGWRDLEPRRTSAGAIEDVSDIDYWLRIRDGKRQVLQPHDVVHLAWHPPTGALGVSPLKQLGVTLRIERSSQLYQEALFRNSARPSGGVTLPESMASDELFRREFRSDLERLHAGTHNAGRPIMLPPGSKWEQFAITAHEAELIQQRQLNREEIAAGYNAPQPLIGILDHATYSNIAELHKILYGPVLGPWIVLGEETFTAQVIAGEAAFEGQFVEFDLSEELRGDVLKEAQALKAQLSIGMLTINEARKIRNLPPIDHPDCDRPMVPTNNMTFVGGDAPAGDEASQALTSNLRRVGALLYRKAKTGENAWDPERFHRELTSDLTDANTTDPAGSAEVWTRAVDAVVTDALNDPDQLRAAFAALSPEQEPTR